MSAPERELPPIKGFMFDLDGTLLLSDRSLGGYEVLPGAVEVLSTLKERGIPFVVLTNGSAYPPAEQAAKLRKLGLPVADERMLTPSSVAAELWPTRGVKRALVLGTRGVGHALAEAGIETRVHRRAARERSRCRLRRLASRVHHEGHRGRLPGDLGRREDVRRLRRAVLRHRGTAARWATRTPSSARSAA